MHLFKHINILSKIFSLHYQLNGGFVSMKLSQYGAAKNPLNVYHLTGHNQGIVVFALNRPQVRNAINFEVISQIRSAIGSVENDENIRVVIVKSDPPHMFCAGADLKERIALDEPNYRRWSWSIRRMTTELSQIPQPSIAAIDGPAIGGGLEIALACDIRIAASNALLGLPETTLGIMPGAGGSQRLPRIIGAARAKELIYTGRIIDAQTAHHRYGLVSHITTQTSTGQQAYLMAETLAREILKIDIRSSLDPEARRNSKQMRNAPQGASMSTRFPYKPQILPEIMGKPGPYEDRRVS